MMNSIFTRKKPDMKVEMQRRATRRISMLQAFKKYGELNTGQMLMYGPGFSSRLKELKRDGHKIVAQYEKPGRWRYVYLGQTDED
jgi:hypothetical protein